MTSQLDAISRHLKTIHSLGVHIGLHLSPSHSKVSGNEAADEMAKKAILNLHAQTNTSWLIVKSVTSIPTQPGPKRFHRGSRVGQRNSGLIARSKRMPRCVWNREISAGRDARRDKKSI